jgi:hypothetical protein
MYVETSGIEHRKAAKLIAGAINGLSACNGWYTIKGEMAKQCRELELEIKSRLQAEGWRLRSTRTAWRVLPPNWGQMTAEDKHLMARSRDFCCHMGWPFDPSFIDAQRGGGDK